ncbi:MAG: oxidoreductase [Sporichthyaceae bacterium]
MPGVAEAVDRARAAVDALRGHRVLRRSAERVASESALRGARASAALAGADLALDVVRRTVSAGGRLPDAEEPVVQGALRVAAETGPLQRTWARAPLQAVARLHTLAAADLAASDGLGRPAPAAAPRLSALGQLLTSTTTAPALVVAAVVHGELATMGAFPEGAGVVARGAARLTLVARGLDPTAVSVPEVGHVELGRDTYRAALDGYATGGADGIAAWVVHCAEAVVLGAREGVAVCEAIQRGA